MKVAIVTLALGHQYPRGVARMIQSFEQHSSGYELQAWVNVLPPGAPERVIVDGFDYSAYCAKPFAMKAAVDAGAEIVLWLDASVHAIAPIQPLIEHISATGYYMAPTGFNIGEWASDACLEGFRLERGGWMDKPECASGIVGLDLRRRVVGKDGSPRELLNQWCENWRYFPGHHSNVHAADKKHHYKNFGHVSLDARCSGHRHDQTVLSVLCHQLGFTNFVPWPKFVAYKAGYGGHANETTCLLIEGV
jgi:hypothetical protein